jgi:hypothetical protein
MKNGSPLLTAFLLIFLVSVQLSCWFGTSTGSNKRRKYFRLYRRQKWKGVVYIHSCDKERSALEYRDQSPQMNYRPFRRAVACLFLPSFSRDAKPFTDGQEIFTRPLQKRAWLNRSSRLRTAVDLKSYGKGKTSLKVNPSGGTRTSVLLD